MIPSGSTVAVTGATGFIGTRLCRQLLAEGFAVRALVRSPPKAAGPGAAGVSLVAGDLDNTGALQELVSGCAAVVHGAGAVRGNCQQDFDRVNVSGTENLLSALAQHNPATRLVHLSSIVAREPDLSFYSLSKRRGEDLLLNYPDLHRVVLRPPAVYGPGDKEMLPIFQTMARGFATVPGSKKARTSLIHIDDLVAAIIAALGADDAAGGVFELADTTSGGYSWIELAAIAGEVFGRKVHLWQVPAPLLNTIAAINIALARLTGRAAMLTPPKLRELRHPDWVADNGPLTAATGWAPVVDFRAGLRSLNL